MSNGAASGNTSAPVCAPPDFHPRRPALALPALACDCHAHILGPSSRYPYSAQRVYTPPDCLLDDFRRMLGALGVERAVLVQPSVYGVYNTVLLEALARAPGRFRGVAVVPPDVDERELERLHELGVRGLRVNVVDVRNRAPGTLPLDDLRALARRIRPLGWHMEMLLHVDEFPELDRALADFPVDLVFGHFGYMRAGSGMSAPGFQALLRLLASGHAWVKLTGPYRISAAALPYPDVAPLAHALAQAAPERLLWGSDWPHVMLKGAMPNDAELCELLATWLPDAALRRRVLVDNPAKLYGF